MKNLISKVSYLSNGDLNHSGTCLSKEEWNIVLSALKLAQNLPLLHKSIQDELDQLEKASKLNCNGKDQYMYAYEDCRAAIEALVSLSMPLEEELEL